MSIPVVTKGPVATAGSTPTRSRVTGTSIPKDAAAVTVAATSVGLEPADRLAFERVHLRLVVEGLHLARAAIHEQEDAALRLRREVGWLRRERVLRSFLALEGSVGARNHLGGTAPEQVAAAALRATAALDLR